MTAVRSEAKPRKRIALTYDDGPGPRTAELLDVLVEEKAGATFFLVGANADRYPEVVIRMAQTPRVEVGSHTLSHVDLASAADQEVVRELTDNAQLLRRMTGQSVTGFRPPWGHHDARVDSTARGLRQSIVLWSLTSMDWKHQNSARIVDLVASNARDGDIVLLHDTLDCTVDATRPLIRELKRQGFQLVSAGELLGEMRPGVKYDGRVSPRVVAERAARTALRSLQAKARLIARLVFTRNKERS